MTGATSGTGTTYPSGAPAFAPVCLLFLVGFVFFNVVKLHVFTFLVPCCDVRYDFRVKDVRSVFNPICYVGSSCFVYVFFLCLFTYAGVQHNFHVRWGSCHLTLTRRMSIEEQELLTFPEHLCLPPVCSGVHVVQTLVFCRSLFVLLLFLLWPLCCLSFFDLRILIYTLVSSTSSGFTPYIKFPYFFLPNSRHLDEVREHPMHRITHYPYVLFHILI